MQFARKLFAMALFMQFSSTMFFTAYSDLLLSCRMIFPVVLSFVVQPANHETLLPFAELARSRNLPIRLLPLDVSRTTELDFYGDAAEVSRVTASLDALDAWSRSHAPTYLREVGGVRAALAAEAAARGARGVTAKARLPLAR